MTCEKLNFGSGVMWGGEGVSYAIVYLVSCLDLSWLGLYYDTSLNLFC